MFLRWMLNSLIILALPYLLPGIQVGSFWTALLVALVLGILNALVRPILIIITLPITLLSLGLFIFILNALLIWFTSSIVKGFEVRSFGSAVLAALVLWLGSMITNGLVKGRPKNSAHH